MEALDDGFHEEQRDHTDQTARGHDIAGLRTAGGGRLVVGGWVLSKGVRGMPMLYQNVVALPSPLN